MNIKGKKVLVKEKEEWLQFSGAVNQVLTFQGVQSMNKNEFLKELILSNYRPEVTEMMSM